MSIRTEIQERHEERFGIGYDKGNQLSRLLDDRRLLLELLDDIENEVSAVNTLSGSEVRESVKTYLDKS